jgi:hypothetical protein
LDEDGYLYIVDRLKDMIITGAENVYSAEVENALASHPAVAACAVLGIPDERWGEAVHAVVVLKEGACASDEDLRVHCRALIAGYKCPRSIEFRSSLPLSGEPVPSTPFQSCWLWAPLNFEDRFTLYHLNADARGDSWNTAGVMGALGDATPEHIPDCRCEVTFLPQSRHIRSAILHFHHRSGPYRGSETRIDLEATRPFYMSGLGYDHPEWSHGYNKGELAFGYDTIPLAQIKTYEPPYLHIQAFVTGKMRLPDGRRFAGRGVLEQMVLGPYLPWGLYDVLDPAPQLETGPLDIA